MANANQGLKQAARLGWEDKLLRLVGADKNDIVKVAMDGIYDKHTKRTWLPQQLDEVLRSHGFESVDVIKDATGIVTEKVYQKRSKGERKTDGNSYAAGRSFAKPGPSTKGSGKRA